MAPGMQSREFVLGTNQSYDQLMGQSRDEVDDWVTQELIDHLVRAEGVAKSFKKTGRHMPYEDITGKQTVGYGHLILPGEDFSAGISDDEAKMLLRKDAIDHMRSLQGSYDQKYGRGAFAKNLPLHGKHALVDFEFNIGNAVGKFPSFTQALTDWDVHEMRRQHVRYRSASPGEVKKKDPRIKRMTKGPMISMDLRNSQMWDSFIAPHMAATVAGTQ